MDARCTYRIIFVPSHEDFEVSKERMERAFALWYWEGYSHILLSGGKTAGADKPSEADAMKGWLLWRGVPSSAIITESGSLDSYQSVRESLALLYRTNMLVDSDLAVVSGVWHCRRLKPIFDWFGFRDVRYIPVEGADDNPFWEALKIGWTYADPSGRGWEVLKALSRFSLPPSRELNN